MTKKILLLLNIVLGLVLMVLVLRLTKKSADDPRTVFQISFIDTSYARLPETADLTIHPAEDEDYLQSVLTALFADFPKTPPPDPEEQSIRILKYVSSALAMRSNEGTATSILKSGYAWCYGRSKAFILLCRTAGLPARQISYTNIPELRSHVLSEVYYDSAWHFYDATFGIFFYTQPQYDGNGTVLSFHDLVRDPSTGYAILNVKNVGTGLFDDEAKAFPTTTLSNESILSDENGEFSVNEFREAIRQAFPISYNRHDIVSYPVDANLLEKKSLWFGSINNDEGELALYPNPFSGSYYLGQAHPPGFHTWLIKTKPFSTIYLEYYSTQAKPPALSLIPLRAAKILENTVEGKKTTFTLQVNDTTAIVSVYCAERKFLVDAMHIYR